MLLECGVISCVQMDSTVYRIYKERALQEFEVFKGLFSVTGVVNFYFLKVIK